MNRLKLDWALSTSNERNAFVQQYINDPIFTSRPLTSDELETIANYVLWGKNENGLSIEQEGLVEMPRRNSTWTSQSVDSLDELTESPTFNENQIYSLTSKAPTKKVREVFSRSETLKTCPAHLTETYKSLWKEIDKTELTINLYELAHEKRTKEPRADLLKNLSEEECAQCADRAKTLNQFKYLKMRHLLVELRREQYTIQDSFKEKITLRAPVAYQEDSPPIFDADIPILPLGLQSAQSIPQLIFQPFNNLVPSAFTPSELKSISSYYWAKKDSQRMGSRCVSFTDLESVYQIFMSLGDLEDEEQNILTTTSNLIETLHYYIKEADLSDLQREILEMKINKQKNQDIASYINKKYNKTYAANYISTIFRQKIIPAINNAAAYHEELIQNIFFKENFKTCTKCGRTLLRDPRNFMRKARASDGFATRCKECDKLEREKKKKEASKSE